MVQKKTANLKESIRKRNVLDEGRTWMDEAKRNNNDDLKTDDRERGERDLTSRQGKGGKEDNRTPRTL